MDNIMAIFLVVFTILNFVVYHKFVRVIYFGSMGQSIVRELIGCLLVACVETAILIKVGQVVFRILIICLYFVLLVFWLVLVYKYWNKIKNSKTIQSNDSQKQVVEGEDNNNDADLDTKEENFIDKNATLYNIIWIAAVLLLPVVFSFAGNSGTSDNKKPNDNYIEQNQETEYTNDVYLENYQETNEDYVEDYNQIEVEDFFETDEIQGIDYKAIYGDIVLENSIDVDSRGGISEYLTYALYDMDQDGFDELILENGTCDADIVFDVYTTNGEGATMLGTIYGNCAFYKVKDGNGIYADLSDRGHEIIAYIYVDGYDLNYDIILEQETENYGYYEGAAIDELKYPIEMTYADYFLNN